MNKTLIVLGCSNIEVLRERSVAAAILLKNKQYTKLILSGGLGNTESGSEAHQMSSIIKKLCGSTLDGVEVILDSESTTTEESMIDICQRESSGFFTGEGHYDMLSSKSHLGRLYSYLWHLKNMDFLDCESIIRNKANKMGLATKSKKHHYKFWLYEFCYPIAKLLPQKLINTGKDYANK